MNQNSWTQQLSYLIQISLRNPRRRRFYLANFTLLNQEEQEALARILWDLFQLQVNEAIQEKKEEMIIDLALNPEATYNSAEWNKIDEQIERQLIARALATNEEQEINKAYEALKALGAALNATGG